MALRYIQNTILVTLVCLNSASLSGKDFFATVSTIKTRAIAMGGAFIAIEGGPGSSLYNPAAVNLYRYPRQCRLTVLVNPIGVGIFSLDQKNFRKKTTFNFSDGLASFGLLIKSIAISLGPFQSLVVFSEESLNHIEARASPKFFDSSGLLEHHSTMGVFSIKLADEISLGASGTLYTFVHQGELKRKLSLSYGVLLKPDRRWNVGLSYIELPTQLPEARHKLEFIEDEAVNFGVSYCFLRNTLFSFEVRNISNEQKWNNRELHFGAEQIIGSHFGFRMGYFREQNNKQDYFSAGIGLLNLNKLRHAESELIFPDFLINYSLVCQKSNDLSDRWHLLSVLFRI